MARVGSSDATQGISQTMVAISIFPSGKLDLSVDIEGQPIDRFASRITLKRAVGAIR